MSDNKYDVIIIGGGPAGGTAALYTSRARLKTLVIDKAVKAGALGMTSLIANWPGIPEISGEDLVLKIQDHAKMFGTEFISTKVVGTYLEDEEKQVFTADGQTYTAKAVILATGAMGKSSTLPGESEFLGKGVSYCATCDAAFFKDRDVAVIGNNEETVHEANFLTRFVKNVYVITPKPKFEADEEEVKELIAKPQVKTLLKTRVEKISGNGKVNSVTIKEGGETKELNVEGVFIFTQGNRPISDYLLEINKTGEGCILVNSDMETNIPGVFACGDILCNKVQQAVVSAGQGCIAALSVDRYINKRSGFKKDYK